MSYINPRLSLYEELTRAAALRGIKMEELLDEVSKNQRSDAED